MRRRYVLIGFALLVTLAIALPAVGAPSPASLAKAALERAQKADRTAHKANKAARKASKTSSRALRTARSASKKASRASKKAGRRGPTGATGPAGAAGLAGTARAYGLIAGNGTLDSSRSKNIAGVAHTVGSGSYCIALAAGIDPSSAGVVAIVDLSDSTTGPLVQWDSKNGAGCAAGQLDIETRQMLSTSAGLPVVEDPEDQGFFFAVP